ncbi:MAG TPA: hypothetical protein DCF84_03390 [Bacteroidetes bacterium]|nr:hypothetical protein [Bacteroidota bacterium]|tara:strand:- start:383 stop:592 length:210 start_codon:yes stop_codon:yes gene_type:complete
MIGVVGKSIFQNLEIGKSKNLSRLASGVSQFSRRLPQQSAGIEVNAQNTLVKELSLHRRKSQHEMNDLY